MNRDKLIDFINKTVEFEEDKDPWLFNGVQVLGQTKVKKIALGVSPSLEMFKQASAWGAEMIILHHGMFGPKIARPITRVLKNRLKVIFNSDMTLLTYHLFLDKHPELGNNAQLIKLLGAKKGKEFGYMEKLNWGFEAEFAQGISVVELKQRLGKLCGGEIKVLGDGPKLIKKFAVVTGGGTYLLPEAADKNLDAFLTGEPKEFAPAWAKEAGIHFFYLGHYNSEKFGVKALGEVVKKKFPSLEFKFIDVPNTL